MSFVFGAIGFICMLIFFGDYWGEHAPFYIGMVSSSLGLLLGYIGKKQVREKGFEFDDGGFVLSAIALALMLYWRILLWSF